VVEVRDVTLHKEDLVVVKNVTFDVRAGEIFVILGRSGAGKTTLLRALIGLEEPSAGEISTLGRSPGRAVSGPPGYGVAFQSGALFGSLTVGENVALPLENWTTLPREVVGAIVCAKLHVVGLHGATAQLPSELSGGMKNRAAIARAMALEPPLLFLDEPSAGLDPVSSTALDELLLLLNRDLGLTVVIVSHELASIFRIATRCIMLDKASQGVIAIGDPRELRDESSDPRVREFFNPVREAR